MLTAKGLLRSRARLGIRVQPEVKWNLLDRDVLGWHLERQFTPSLLMEFTELRLSIEPAAAALAARSPQAARTRRIEVSLKRIYAADRGNEALLDAEIAFHVSVLCAAGNCFFAQFTSLTTTALRISHRAANILRPLQPRLVMCQSVVDAIVMGSPSLAETAMRTLIVESVGAPPRIADPK